MKVERRSRIAVWSGLFLFFLITAAGSGGALPASAGQALKLVADPRPQAASGFGGCGPGVCVGDSFCDDCACYAPETPISQVACRCHLMDPACGLGECVGGTAYCEGPFCPAPVCYDPTSPISQVLCQGAELDKDCKVKKSCGPGYCLGDSFCDDCACYAPEAPISQVACRCHLMDPACGLGECVGGGSYCEGPFCPAPVCYSPTSPISQVLCQGGTLGPGCKVACTPPPYGMKAWWPFDETSGSQAFDIIGANHGTYQNGPVPTTGKVAQALFFDGVDDYVSAPAVNPHDYSSLTVDAWIYPEARNTAEYGLTIVNFDGFDLYALRLDGDELRFDITTDEAGYDISSSGANIPLRAWTHVAVVADRVAGEIRFYVNGNLITVYASYRGSAIFPTTRRWIIGSHQGYREFFKGAIDEVEIFERPLAQSEIQAIYSAGPGGKCK